MMHSRPLHLIYSRWQQGGDSEREKYQVDGAHAFILISLREVVDKSQCGV